MNKQYQKMYQDGKTLVEILMQAYFDEEGIVDYIQLLEPIMPEKTDELKQAVAQFLESWHVKYYAEFAELKRNGAAFTEILALLEKDNRFKYPHSNITFWFPIAYLMMKLFKLSSWEEFTDKKAEITGVRVMSGAETIAKAIEEGWYDQIWDNDEASI